MLADFGADVVMVEGPEGHPLRAEPPFDADGDSIAASLFLANKRSIQLDLESADDRQSLVGLALGADVIVSSLAPAAFSALQLDYAAFENERLVLCHVTPFGMTGARANQPGNELSVAALCGWASLNGDADRSPLKPSGHQVAFCSGTAAYGAIVAALIYRDANGGKGQEIDVAELEVMVSAASPAVLRGQYLGTPATRRQAVDITTGPVPVRDGHFALTISRAHFWRDAMNVLGLEDLAEDTRWETSWYRAAHKNEYTDRVGEAMSEWTKGDLFEELAARRVVAGPVLTMEELRNNEHLVDRDFWVRVGDDTYPGPAFRMSETPWEPPRAGPSPRRQPAGVERMSGPLAGMRGIVLTQAWAGTYCTELLAFMGADLIQIEVLQRPDAWRGSYDAPLAGRMKDVPTAEHSWNCNFLYNSVNLNKRCITLNLQHPDGMTTFKQLLPLADFVVENFSPRVLGNLGIDYEAMCEIKPDVILCSLSAYGHSGPWANIPGIGGTIEPTSGMSALLGYPDRGPMNSGQMYPDAVAGLNGFAALMTALRHRQQTGEGQYIDLSMQEANLVFVGDAALEYLRSGKQRPRRGNRHPRWAPHGIYPCAGAEHWLAISCEADEQWAALKKILDNPALEAAEFDTLAGRKSSEDALDAAIAATTKGRERDELVVALIGAGVIAAPVLDAVEVAADAALRARNVIAEVTHPEAGTWPQSGIPWHFSAVPNPGLRPAPRLGEHSAEVLAELLGTTEAEYESLVSAGVSGTEPPK